ncbi:enoyl-CoA hydratase/isomerase family protein [Actinomadura scrupuli]|uniref:enoyl-CoA hydratase/isomerase family protein n=1 Tax=Actinomadura scrupuli TaxID=559629 RepID=UPI003D9811D6
MYETVTYEVGEYVARITLNRPAARNALNDQMTGELLDALKAAKNDDAVRVIVLTGAGDRAFCAGADLGGLGSAQRSGAPIAGVAGPGNGTEPHPAAGGGAHGEAAGAQEAAGSLEAAGAQEDAAIRDSAIYRLFTAFPRLGKPVIARLAGHAIAGGLGLAASCDLVIAADDVKLATPEVNVGLWPMMIMAIINRNVAPKQAFKLYYTGQTITAREGREIGLVTEVVPRADLDARVDELARTIAAKSPLGLRLGRDAFHAIEGRPLDDQIAHLLGQLVTLAGTDDAKEGIAAFLEKRTPDFKGR